MAHAKFDGLAQGYDRHRPRYPHALIEQIKLAMPAKDRYVVADIGAGTGIALEGLIPSLGEKHDYHAVDISSDMIEHGRMKFPHVRWHLGKAEDVISDLPQLDLILAAQSFQWMDRQTLLAAAVPKLSAGGLFAVLQNNRDYINSAFLDQYEALLEAMSPGYSRHYRSFDFQAELADAFACQREAVKFKTHGWSTWLPVAAFVGMSQSSTQVQRAIAAHGDAYSQQLDKLLDKHQRDGQVELRYESQLFLIARPSAV